MSFSSSASHKKMTLINTFVVCLVAQTCFGSSILHPNLKVISVNDNGQGKPTSFDVWTPSPQDIKSAEHKLHAHGNITGAEAKQSRGGFVLLPRTTQNHSDYIDTGRKITRSRSAARSGRIDVVVELLVVCDKEFADVFNQDRSKIIEYLTIYYWDMNIRFQTLGSVNYALRINSVAIINSFAVQPFIEEARNEAGVTEKGRILPRFGQWVRKNMPAMPKFDVAVLMTNAAQEWGGGLAYMRSACGVGADMYWGTAVWDDKGGFNSVTIGAHEIALVLGAPHDDPDLPGGGCSENGRIMGGGDDDKRYFFSTCSDRFMSEYARSNEGSCLRTIDYKCTPRIDPGVAYSYTPPSMQEQCRRTLHPEAWVEVRDQENCKNIRCVFPSGKGFYWVVHISPVENTQCSGGGNCFRGKCRKPGVQLENVGTGLCMKGHDPSHPSTAILAVNCSNSGSPIDHFVVNDTSNGKILGTPFATAGGARSDDKCLYTAFGDVGGYGQRVWTDVCNMGDNPWHGWDFIETGNGEFLVRHRVTGRCAYPTEYGYVFAKDGCNRNDATLRWRIRAQ